MNLDKGEGLQRLGESPAAASVHLGDLAPWVGCQGQEVEVIPVSPERSIGQTINSSAYLVLKQASVKHLPCTLPRLCAPFLMDNKQVNGQHVTTREDQSCEGNEQGVGTKGRVCQGSPPCRDRVRLSPEGSVGISQARSRSRQTPPERGSKAHR